MYRFDKSLHILILSMSLALVTTQVVQAEIVSCIDGKYTNGSNCEKCGDNCNWTLDTENGKLSVFGSGNMYNYSSYIGEDGISYSTSPWGEYERLVKSVDVAGVSSIGSCAFCHNNISDITISDSVTSMGGNAFAWNGTVIESVILPDSLTSLPYIAFRGSVIGSITVPATISGFGTGSLGLNKNYIENMEIICIGTKEDCQNLQTRLSEYTHYSSDYNYEQLDLSGNVRPADFNECHSTNYYWNGADCVREPDKTKRKCCESCKDMGGYCNRIRYTPAEAADILTDDNNSFTITFKK